jgi:formylglycine-generating enzyme required for sulfatase activity
LVDTFYIARAEATMSFVPIWLKFDTWVFWVRGAWISLLLLLTGCNPAIIRTVVNTALSTGDLAYRMSQGHRPFGLSGEHDYDDEGSKNHEVENTSSAGAKNNSIRTSNLPSATSAKISADPPVTMGPFTVGQKFKDCHICPEMVVVPSGTFLMRSPTEEPERAFFEGPRRKIEIRKTFAVSIYETTFGEWDACVADNGCEGHRPDDLFLGRGRRAAVDVSWEDAQSYVAWLSQKTGVEYRLLSEAEWEYVARAGTNSPFNTGDRISSHQANFDGEYTYNGSLKGIYRGPQIAVGHFGANGFGLHDVHGNVSEWVQDCWNNTYDSTSADSAANG